ncbi:c2H2-type domain-containing protein [Trichonephila clavipes]|nr:c2H2-type domain-containing protein [Trichonephila clavipes]
MVTFYKELGYVNHSVLYLVLESAWFCTLALASRILNGCQWEFLLRMHLEEYPRRQENWFSSSCIGFICQEDFLKWKEKIELDSRSFFRLRSASEKVGVKFSYYVCHRSGYSKPKLNRVRHMKASGSVRCGCTCPAVINVSTHTVEEAKEITVQYQSVHVGHDMEVGKLNLSKAEKSSLASSLCLGIPMATILDKKRERNIHLQRDLDYLHEKSS